MLQDPLLFVAVSAGDPDSAKRLVQHMLDSGQGLRPAACRSRRQAGVAQVNRRGLGFCRNDQFDQVTSDSVRRQVMVAVRAVVVTPFPLTE
jgi:hypothetical protein